jgi:hypothetical protein
MRPGNPAAVVSVAAALCVPATASAQEPVASFSQVGDRLKPGDTVWVTDAQGREVKGRIGSVTAETIALEGDAAPAFQAGEVRLVRHRDPARRIWTGAAIGAIAGLGVGIAACAAYPKDDPLRGDACLMAVGLTWMPGFGAGALVGAAFPGKKQAIVYRAPGPEGKPGAELRASIAPMISPRAKGVAVAFSF